MDILISMQPHVAYRLVMPRNVLRRLSLITGDPYTISSGIVKI